MVDQIDIEINTNVVDSPILEETQFGDNMKNWLTNFVDIFNSEINSLESVVNVINNLFNTMIAVGTINASTTLSPFQFTVPVLGMTASSFVVLNLLSISNPGVTILSVVPGTNQFVITFSGNTGASAIISYVVFRTNPQG